MWHDTKVTRRLGVQYPIVQGPFGGGLSSPRLAAAVSSAGGLGSFGAQGMTPAGIVQIVQEIRGLTDAPFAMNLWVSTEDPGALGTAESRYAAAMEPLAQFFRELELEPPALPLNRWPGFEEQVAALLEAQPPVFSFVFGILPASVLEECRRRGIVTIGAATTPDEALALEEAGVDMIVASGAEAGGHRPSFLRPPEVSLTGTFSLIPQVADAVRVPVIAAGGIADGRGVAAALALGADGVQIGTAFLACEESNATAAHREALLSRRGRDTMLTRAFTGRLARGLRNRLAEALEQQSAPLLPYPLQGQLVGALREEALRRGRLDLVALWSGQSAALIRHRRAAELFQDLVEATEKILNGAGIGSTGDRAITGA
jgi:nitronate monooxygenase